MKLPSWGLAVGIIGGIALFLIGGLCLHGPLQKGVVAAAIALLLLVLPFFSSPER